MSDDKELLQEQAEFVAWLKDNDMYSAYDSASVMRKMHDVWKKLIPTATDLVGDEELILELIELIDSAPMDGTEGEDIQVLQQIINLVRNSTNDEWISIRSKVKPKHGAKCRVWTTDADDMPVEVHATWNEGDGFLVTGGYKDPDIEYWQLVPDKPTGEE